MPGQTQHLAEPNEERRNAAEEKSVIRFVAAACDEGMRQSQAQIAQGLLAEETLQIFRHLHVGERVGAVKHTIVSLDAGKFRSKGTDAPLKPRQSKDKWINARAPVQHRRQCLMRGGIRLLQNDQQIYVRQTLDIIPADRAAIQTARIKIRTERIFESIDGVRKKWLEGFWHQPEHYPMMRVV